MRRGASTQGCLAHIDTTPEDAGGMGHVVPGIVSEDGSK